ncbi:MAG TPA: hypothetical protein VFA47_00480 [Candidatus Manganitrophaceae bacterium]|nr:hypothetical protein [Candidatus Manganitrophaceae bacterium]
MKRTAKIVLAAFVFLSAILLIQLLGNPAWRWGEAEAKMEHQTALSEENDQELDENAPQIKAAIAIHKRHTNELMAIPDVVGTATGISEEGKPAVLVFAKRSMPPGMIAESLEGLPVRVTVTGEIVDMRRGRRPPGGGGNPGGNPNTAIFPPPVPIGVSTGNVNECSAGTIAARVKDTAGVYALSNNHVYALENKAPIGSEILQPGLVDTQCVSRGNNPLGALSRFVPINFAGGPNTVDAAIGISTVALLGNATPPGGYGAPNSAITIAAIGQAVQKYGRTTSLTHGTVTGINATVTVNYGASGNATFVNQIIVNSSGAFIQAGDSGSLLVTDDTSANPVGLLFAGNSNGTMAIANQIGNVLSSLGVVIDGK